MRIPLRKPSPAMVVACCGVVLGLGSTAYALTIPRNSVGTPQLKRNAVTSGKLKDGAVRPADLGRGAATAPLQSGETVTGAIGLDLQNPVAGSDFSIVQNLPAPPPDGLVDETVDVDVFDEVNGRCTGSAVAPTAPRGVLCMYPIDLDNAASVRGDAVGDTGEGFLLLWVAPAANDTLINAAWAYTAP